MGENGAIYFWIEEAKRGCPPFLDRMAAGGRMKMNDWLLRLPVPGS
jgi:hypothetical protein